MQKLVIWSICFFFFGFQAFAHDAHEAYFSITTKQSWIEVEAEFPWTIRNALLTFKPELEQAPGKKDFDNAFFEYVAHNLVLKSTGRSPLLLTEVTELKHKGHSHQVNYIFKFQKGLVQEVKNTLMFNVSEKQKNFHKVYRGGKVLNFLTQKDQINFNITGVHNNHSNWWQWLLLMIPILLIGLLFLRKNRT